jgi:hypothetical protein
MKTTAKRGALLTDRQAAEVLGVCPTAMRTGLARLVELGARVVVLPGSGAQTKRRWRADSLPQVRRALDAERRRP